MASSSHNNNNAELESLLRKVGLANLTERFQEEKLDVDSLMCATEKDLTRLGVSTIGDRVRLREACRQLKVNINNGHGFDGIDQHLSASNISANNNPTTHNRAAQVRAERSMLFRPTGWRRARGAGAAGGRRYSIATKTKPRPWTGNFMCLANKFSTRIPNAEEKDLLTKAGLGYKKIKLDLEDSEEDVCKKLTSNEKTSDGDIMGFPKLKEAGGFEIMKCVSNCRDLSVIEFACQQKPSKAWLGVARVNSTYDQFKSH